MKLTLTHHHHAPSPSIIEMIEKELEAMLTRLQIDEARVCLELNQDESPPYTASFHLVTPGPDVVVSASDHTLQAAVLKAFQRIEDKIHHRPAKRSSRREVAPAIELSRRRPPGRPRN